MSNLKSRLKARQVPTKDVPICLDLNLIAERDEAMSRLASAQRMKSTSDRMVAPSDINAIAAEVASIEDRIRNASIIIRISGVDRATYNGYFLQAPPRKGRNEPFDPTKFFMIVARANGQYVDENGTAHAMTDDEWDDIDKALTDGEHDRIANAVLSVNREAGGSDLGFLGRASGTTHASSGTSAQPDPSA